MNRILTIAQLQMAGIEEIIVIANIYGQSEYK